MDWLYGLLKEWVITPMVHEFIWYIVSIFFLFLFVVFLVAKKVYLNFRRKKKDTKKVYTPDRGVVESSRIHENRHRGKSYSREQRKQDNEDDFDDLNNPAYIASCAAGSSGSSRDYHSHDSSDRSFGSGGSDSGSSGGGGE